MDKEVDTLEKVREFHYVFGHLIEDTPNVSNKKVNTLRISLLQEELDELKEALDNNDVVSTLDALTDLQYVLDGAFLSLGFGQHKYTAFNEVHRSNMSKLGEDGKPIYRKEDGKVLKGPNYSPPDLSTVIRI